MPEERLGWEALGRDLEKQPPADLNSVTPAQTELATFPERCRSLPEDTAQEKENALPWGLQLAPPSGTLPATLYSSAPGEETAARPSLQV